MTIPTALRIVVVLAALQMSNVAFAQDAEDFKGSLAMGRRECTTASLPYEDLRRAAESKQEDVTRWCKTEYRSCKGLETRSLRTAIDRTLPDAIRALEDERDRLRRDRDAAQSNERSSIESKISDVERKIDEKKKELDFSKTSLGTDKSDAEKRINNGKNCAQARKDMNAPFRDAMSRAKSVDQSKYPEIKPMAIELVDIWEKCERSHEPEIRTVEEVINYCKRAQNGDE